MIAVFDFKARTSRRLTEYDCWSLFPQMSPDGSRIAFSSSRKGTFDIHIMNSAPDGSKLVFGTRSSGIFIIDVDGKRRMALSETGHRPSFAPHGKRVVFQQSPSFRVSSAPPGRLWTINADGSDSQPLPHRGIEAVWSPDITSIVFVSNIKNPRDLEIYLAKSDGSGLKQLTTTGGYKGGLSFSVDGAKLFFWHRPSSGSPGRKRLNYLQLNDLVVKTIELH
jgi:Tol biopolymer transport system component